MNKTAINSRVLLQIWACQLISLAGSCFFTRAVLGLFAATVSALIFWWFTKVFFKMPATDVPLFFLWQATFVGDAAGIGVISARRIKQNSLKTQTVL